MKGYKVNSQNWANYLEIALGSLYFVFLVWALLKAYWVVVPFLALFTIGFFYIGLLSWWERSKNQRQARSVSLNSSTRDIEEGHISDSLIIAE
jgi:hypothetical protein